MPGKAPQEEADFRMTCGGYSSARDYMRPEAWESLTSEQRDKWAEMWGAYLTDTLPLRQEFAQKRLDLQTAWAQLKVDSAKIDKLCDEMSELYIERMKKRKDYLLKCRQVFGDLGWTASAVDRTGPSLLEAFRWGERNSSPHRMTPAKSHV